MERREPTLSSTPTPEPRDENPARRHRQTFEEPRSASSVYVPPPTSSLPAIALVIGFVGVFAAAFLAYQMVQMQHMLDKDSARIQQLENQLTMASDASNQSVTALNINLQRVDGEVKKLWDASRKTNSDSNDRFSNVNKTLEANKNDLAGLKSDSNTLKQESLAHKANLDDLTPRLEQVEKNIAEQRKKLQDVTTSVTTLSAQVKNSEGLAARVVKAEEAIDAIDENRRTINRDLLTIKTQLNIKN